MKFEFTTNDLTVKNNRSLKNRGQFALEMEIERTLLPQVVGLEAWAEGTHFKVTIEPVDSPKSEIKEPKKERTMYQLFKDKCIEYSGEDYYNRLKKHLGVEHLKDLEKNHTYSMICDLLTLQKDWIDSKIFCFKFSVDITELVHKDNALNLWHTLFDLFNNSK